MTGAKTALITGAATGIGQGLAKKLDAEGWSVFAGFNRTPPDELIERTSKRLTALPLDVTDKDAVKRAAAVVEEAVGDAGLQLVVNNAAMTGAPGSLETIDIAVFKHLFDVNFWGPLRVGQAMLPALREHPAARIVNVTSASLYMTVPLGASYPISKVALRALTEHMRAELAPFAIEVTELCPGGVATPMTSFPPEEEARTWASFPAHLLELYRAAFKYPGSVFEKGFKFESPDAFAERIYARIITADRLKPYYHIGPGVASLVWMNRSLPRTARERLFARMFRRG